MKKIILKRRQDKNCHLFNVNASISVPGFMNRSPRQASAHGWSGVDGGLGPMGSEHEAEPRREAARTSSISKRDLEHGNRAWFVVLMRYTVRFNHGCLPLGSWNMLVHLSYKVHTVPFLVRERRAKSKEASLAEPRWDGVVPGPMRTCREGGTVPAWRNRPSMLMPCSSQQCLFVV